MSGGSTRSWQRKMSNIKLTKEKIKGGVDLLLGGLILAYVGSVYDRGGFGLAMIYVFALAIMTVPVLFTVTLRRLGTLAAWCGMGASFFLLWYTGKDLATAVLVWSLTCAVPVSVSVIWPLYPKIKPLAMRALPVAGGIAALGTLLYNRLHFGGWNYLGMAKQMVTRIEGMTVALEQLYGQVYAGQQLKEMQTMMQFLRTNSTVLAFTVIQLAVYALFGLFFLSVWYADRKASRDGMGRMLGSWHTMIPSPWVSRLYMLGYLIVLFLSGRTAQNMIATFDLFGFLFVFVALYRLLQFFRKKGLPSFAKKGIIGGLFVLSYLTVGNSLLSPYMILLYAGWWIATFPVFITVQKK